MIDNFSFKDKFDQNKTILASNQQARIRQNKVKYQTKRKNKQHKTVVERSAERVGSILG